MAKEIITGEIYTSDNVPISFERTVTGSDTVVVVCPGFFNSKKNRWMKRAADIVSAAYDTVIFDFRGHGDSKGKFTWSAKEHMDLDAVIDYCRGRGYKKVGILAFSLGAAASVNAAARNNEIKSMVLISTPMSFWEINYHFWEPEMLSDLKDNIECSWEGKGARVDHLFIPKPKPITNVSRIKRIPIFFIHGDSDWIIKDYHSKRLFEAAQTEKKLEIIKDGLHAERLIQQHPEKMKKMIMEWFKSTL